MAFEVTTKSHRLYGTFLSRLSLCIFEWDEGDVEALLDAKYAEHSRAGVPSPVLLLSLSNATDLLREPILREEMKDIWEEQSRHVACIQDPQGVALHTITGHIEKGEKRLPVLRCAGGFTSLESFHCHLVRFIPGTSASAIYFQACLHCL